jgi:hypothetical protein
VLIPCALHCWTMSPINNPRHALLARAKPRQRANETQLSNNTSSVECVNIICPSSSRCDDTQSCPAAAAACQCLVADHFLHPAHMVTDSVKYYWTCHSQLSCAHAARKALVFARRVCWLTRMPITRAHLLASVTACTVCADTVLLLQRRRGCSNK